MIRRIPLLHSHIFIIRYHVHYKGQYYAGEFAHCEHKSIKELIEQQPELTQNTRGTLYALLGISIALFGFYIIFPYPGQFS